jgi:hypothetical protein
MIKKINCPECSHSFPIESALAETIRSEFDREFEEKEKKFRRQLLVQQERLEAEAQKAREGDWAKWKNELAQAEAHAKELAELENSRKLREQDQKLAAQAKLLDQFAAEEKLLRDIKDELERKAKNVEFEIARGLEKAKEELLRGTQEELSFQYEIKIKEKELQIQQLAEQVKQMGRTAGQKSQQLQGEALEVLLQGQLMDEFPNDEIVEVKKGARGGDFNQKVRSRSGADCGAIHIECKNAKEWSDAWIGKAKEDTRNHGAHVTVIVSAIVPKEISSFGIYEGVFVCSPAYSRQLIALLRNHMIEDHKLRIMMAGKGDTKESLFDYFMGAKFRQRVERMVEVQQAMRDSLEREKRAYQKLFAQREKQIDSIFENTVGVFGDLQGILGDKNLPDIALLSLPSMVSEEND